MELWNCTPGLQPTPWIHDYSYSTLTWPFWKNPQATSVTLEKNLRDNLGQCPALKTGKTEAQRSQVTCPVSRSSSEASGRKFLLSLRPRGRILCPCFEHLVSLLCKGSPHGMEGEALQLGYRIWKNWTCYSSSEKEVLTKYCHGNPMWTAFTAPGTASSKPN